MVKLGWDKLKRLLREKIQAGATIYAADAGSTDAYAVTLDPIPTAYTTGMVVNFKANTANTGTATLNVNGLGAKTIRKMNDQTLEDNDIEAAQLVTVIYDGTYFQMQSQLASSTGTGATVRATSPTMVTPTLGAASATSINKVAITAPANGSTFTIADGKTLTASNTLTLTGTDSSSVAFGTGGTVAYTANKLSAFAATSSSELAGVISDETGSGSLVFATSPTFVTPLLGTPTSGDLQNCTAATTSAKGVSELATPTESVAGESTTLVNTPSGAAAQIAVHTNPKAFAQGINLTASVAVGGIASADDDDIDFATGNFGHDVGVLLADYTPAADVILYQKHDGSNGYIFKLLTTGYLRLTINAANYDSTVTLASVGITDGYAVGLGFSVTRETASVAGSVLFAVNKNQLGASVAITAGAPATVSNAVSGYTMGTSSTRYAGTVYYSIPYNRARTAAEHASSFTNGIAFADKWGSQTVGIIATGDNSTFASDTGFWSKSGVTVTIPGDGYAYFTDSPDSSFLSPASADVFTIGDYYRITVTVAGYTKGALRVTDGDGGGVWGIVVADGVHSFDRKATRTDLYLLTAGETTLKVDTIVITKLGATLALEPSGIKTPKWFDSSTNALDASYPTTGSSLTLSYQPGTESLLSITTVALNADADTTIFTVPTGRRCVLTKAILVVGADAASTDFSIGADGAETDWLPTNQLDNLDAANDAAILMPVPSTTPSKIESYAAGTVIQAKVSNQAGGATNTLYLFGFLY